MKLSELRVDPDKLETGDWVDNIPQMGDLRLRVKGLGTPAYRRMQSKLFDAVPRQKRPGGRVDQDEQDRITSQCLLACVLLDWDGLTDDAEEPVPFSRDKAQELLFEPAYRSFRDAVIWAASVVGEDATGTQEDAAKNSVTPSAGS